MKKLKFLAIPIALAAAGVAWLLEQLDREPTADEAAYRTLWEAQDFSR